MTTHAPPIKRLPAILAEVGKEFAKLAGANVVYRVGGPEEVGRNDPASRVVMEPFGRVLESSKGGADTLYSRIETVRMHIWGLSMDEVEELEELVINAIVRVVAWAMRPGPGAWNYGGTNARGVALVQELSFVIPIQRRAVEPSHAAFPGGAFVFEVEGLQQP